MTGLQDFGAWHRAIRLVRAIYDMSRTFPAEERFGLTSQIRRAAVSVPSNIAEGHAREGTRDYARFISHAQGSLAEVHTQMYIAIELGYCSKADVEALLDEIDRLSRTLNKARRSLIPNPQSRIPNQ